jgi:hypothetical protein
MRDVEMDRARFEELAEAYGGAVARWPAEARGAAQAFLSAEPEAAREILARAESLDAALDAWRPMPVRHELRERVVARAPRAIRGAEWLSWVLGAGAGAGLAMACAAGLVLGVFMSGATATMAANDEPVSAVMRGYEVPIQVDGAAT